MAFPALDAVEAERAAKAATLRAVFDEAGPDLDMSKVKSLSGDTTDKVAEIRKMNAELDELGVKADGLRELKAAADRAAKIPGQSEPGDSASAKGRIPAQRKSVGELFVESEAYGRKGRTSVLDVEVKTLMERGAGWEPEVTRSGRIEELAQAENTAADLFFQTTTNQAAIKWMQETVRNVPAAEVAEGGPYAEAQLALEEQSTVVQKIGVWIPVTDEQLEDEGRARDYIDRRLGFGCRQRLSWQCLNGDGVGTNLLGLLNVVGIQTQAKGTDPVPDAIYKALTKTRTVGIAIPDAVVMNPLDWQDVRLLRTTDGVYIWGSPSEAGPQRIWGYNVTLENALAAGTGLVGDFGNFAELSMRRGIEVQITNSHSDFFINGKQAIRADLRAAVAVYRPAAFCTVTGI